MWDWYSVKSIEIDPIIAAVICGDIYNRFNWYRKIPISPRLRRIPRETFVNFIEEITPTILSWFIQTLSKCTCFYFLDTTYEEGRVAILLSSMKFISVPVETECWNTRKSISYSPIPVVTQVLKKFHRLIRYKTKMRKTGWSPIYCRRWLLRRFVPSTRGPEWTDRWSTSCSARSIAG